LAKTNFDPMAETENSKHIKSTADKVFQALIDPRAIEIWQVPNDMTGKVHSYNFKVGGKYEMSLYYPDTENTMKGKSGEKEDKFTAEFIEIIPNKKIVEKVHFQSDNPSFKEPMTMQINLEPESDGTKVTFAFKNIPKGIEPEDNEAGTISSLEKLAKLVEK
jgi:uncharacterized protein YndB with AHSA1/START domain